MSQPELRVQMSVEGLEQVKGAFQEVINGTKGMEAATVTSAENISTNYKTLASNISHLATAGLALESTWRRVAEGQMGVLEGVIRTIPTFISLASAIWGVVTAEHARAIAHAVASAIATWGAATPAIIAATAVALGSVGALIASMPSKQMGGFISETGPYLLHRGETVIPSGRAGASIIFDVHDNLISEEEFLDRILEHALSRLRQEGMIT